MSELKEGIEIKKVAIIAILAIVGSYLIGYLITFDGAESIFYGFFIIIAFLMLLSVLLAMVGGILYNFYHFVSPEPGEAPADS